MAAPAAVFRGSSASKTTGTTLVVPAGNADAVGNYVCVGFSMDPTSGAVSFAKTGGTGAIGAWTTAQDISNGSGTSGVRTVLAYAPVTSAGTVQVTITHPSVAARAADVFEIQGVDATTPVVGSGSATNAASTLGIAIASGSDVLALGVQGGQSPGSATPGATSISPSTGWTLVTQQPLTQGTSGGGSASNICVLYAAWSATSVAAQTLNLLDTGVGGTTADIGIVWQAPLTTPDNPPTLGLLKPNRLGKSLTETAGALNRASRW